MTTNHETTLAKVRLHWGIFIPVLLVVFFLVLATVPVLFVVHMMGNMADQMAKSLNQQPQTSHFGLLWVVVLLPDFLFCGALMLGTWISYSKSEVTLTNRRLLFRTGFLSRRSGELPLENIESIFIAEPLLGRLCGYGSVVVTTVGGARFPLTFIGEPQTFHSLLQSAVSSAKRPFVPSPVPQTGDDDSRYMRKG